MTLLPLRRRVLTWHVHGTYLELLGAVGNDFFVPVKPGRPPGYAGLPPGRQWPSTLVEVPADEVADLDLDCVLYQSDENWEKDQYEILSPGQRRLPRLFLEHDPPGHDRGTCFDSRHPVDDPDVVIVHVTSFNDLMWDTGPVPTIVIDHAVPDRGHAYKGDEARGLVVVNHLERRGRRLGFDIYERIRDSVPLDLVGMDSERSGGLGEIPPGDLTEFASSYRFFFHPIRYTSLGLALCEAMMAGIPVVAVATTEAVTVIEDGVTGYVHTDTGRLISGMQHLLESPDDAAAIGAGGRRRAQERFSIDRFAREWRDVIDLHSDGALVRSTHHERIASLPRGLT